MLAQLAADPGDVETDDYWVIYDDGSVGRVATTGEEPVLSRPGRLVTEEEYQERAGELAAEREAHLARLAAEDEVRTRAAYEAFLEAGFPEEVARQMSGYTGQTDGD
ncbi:hypothetical protein ACFVH9_07370 [Streptomyces hirsutus]|uniref:hypothetical protein n=1 Tax=Streptomyces hirsutus TaxID=35620 RepID=UPI0036296F50